jgi:hypothetical protein
MNARKVQIDFGEATPLAPVALHRKSSTSARSADIKEMNLVPKPGQTGAGEIPEETARPNLFMVAKKPFSRPEHPIRWGINE